MKQLTRELGNPFKPILGKYGNYEIYEDGKTTQLEANQAQIPAIERAAMERVFEGIEAKLHGSTREGVLELARVDLEDLEFELLEGDKINKEGE